MLRFQLTRADADLYRDLSRELDAPCAQRIQSPSLPLIDLLNFCLRTNGHPVLQANDVQFKPTAHKDHLLVTTSANVFDTYLDASNSIHISWNETVTPVLKRPRTA